MVKKLALFSRDLSAFSSLAEARALVALSDDAKRDITSEACIGKGTGRAAIIAREGGVVCGIIEAGAVLSPALKVRWRVKEGAMVHKGSVIAEIEGSTREILRRERTALNYLCVLSGIATESAKLSKKFKGRISSLRKTHPCITIGEKRAVSAGGLLTHRLCLSDGYLVKNNHVSAIARSERIGRGEAIRRAIERCIANRKRTKKKCFIEVEVQGEKEALAAAKTKADAIMIDNRSPVEFRKISRAIKKLNKKVIIEASGGITPKNAGAYLKAGADFCSTSWLTMRARPLDIHLELV